MARFISRVHSPSSRYLVLPLCFSQLQSTAPRKFAISAHSTTPLAIEPIQLPSGQLGTAMIQRRQHGEHVVAGALPA